MKFTPIVLASLLLTLISCRKGDPIEGKVMNLATNLPVQNLTVTLRKGYFGSDFGSSKGKAIDVTTTNTSGVYNFENTYKKKDRSDMYVYIDNEDSSYYFDYGSGYEHYYTLKDLEEYNAINLTPTGTLTITVNNEDCASVNERFTGFFGHDRYDIFNNGRQVTYIGCYSQSLGKRKVPMGWYKIHGKVILGANSTDFRDSIYIKPGKTHEWNIVY